MWPFTSSASVEDEVPSEEKREDAFARIEAFLDRFAFLDDWANKTGVPKLFLALLIFVVAFYSAVRMMGLSSATNAFGFVYPAYRSFKTLENEEMDYIDQIEWLMYWTVFGLFYLLEIVFHRIADRFALYYLFKVIFLIWCFLPRFRGAAIVYNRCVRPMFKEREQDIDQRLRRASVYSAQASDEVSRMFVSSIVSRALQPSPYALNEDD